MQKRKSQSLRIKVTVEQRFELEPLWTKRSRPAPPKQVFLDLPGVLIATTIEEEYTILSQVKQLQKMTPDQIAEALEEEAFQREMTQKMNVRRVLSRQCLTGSPLRISSQQSRELQVCKHCGTSLDPKYQNGDRWYVREYWPTTPKDWWLVCLVCSEEIDRQDSLRHYKAWIKEQIKPTRKDLNPLRAGQRDKLPTFEIWWKAFKKDGMRMDMRDEHSSLYHLSSTLDEYRVQ